MFEHTIQLFLLSGGCGDPDVQWVIGLKQSIRNCVPALFIMGWISGPCCPIDDLFERKHLQTRSRYFCSGMDSRILLSNVCSVSNSIFEQLTKACSRYVYRGWVSGSYCPIYVLLKNNVFGNMVQLFLMCGGCGDPAAQWMF